MSRFANCSILPACYNLLCVIVVLISVKHNTVEPLNNGQIGSGAFCTFIKFYDFMEVVLFRKLEQFGPELKGYSIYNTYGGKEHITNRLHRPSAVAYPGFEVGGADSNIRCASEASAQKLECG